MTEPGQEDPLVPLCRFGQYQQAALVRQALENEGIPTVTEGENFSALFGLGAEAPWSMRLLVRRSDRPRAVALLKEMENAEEIDVLEEQP